MHITLFVGFLLAGIASANEVNAICPILGPPLPYPTALSKSAHFTNATATIEAAIFTALRTGNSTSGAAAFNETSFSIGVFSISEPGLLYERHYLAPDAANSSIGTKKVTADSVYRVGSVSKLLAAYAYMIVGGEKRLYDPITHYVPELVNATTSSDGGALPRWHDVTIADLLSHTAGLAGDYGQAELVNPGQPIDGTGLPSLPKSDVPKCGWNDIDDFKSHPCTREEFLAGLKAEPAIFNVGHTPSYSNNGFSLLGLMLERMGNSSLDAVWGAAVADPLCLKHTTWTTPDDASDGVIPVSAGWNNDLGPTNAAGSAFSSINDLAAIGRAILGSTLLSHGTTQRWLKPKSHTSNPMFSMGAPWEIYRRTIGANGIFTDLYTKGGDFPPYHADFVLLPDYGIGLSVLAAGTDETSGFIPTTLSSLLLSHLMPAVHAAAASEARTFFGGRYVDGQSNSSLSITAQDTKPGLQVTEWISNGVDFLEVLNPQPSKNVEYRLYPNFLYGAKSGKVGFSGIAQSLPNAVNDLSKAVLAGSCSSWDAPGGPTWGNVVVGDFVFKVDGGGRARAAIPKALRARYENVE